MRVYLLDGTYELFRQYFGQPSRRAGDGTEVAAARAVVGSVVTMLGRDGVTHLGVATDHVIESFRNELWPGYKTSAGVPSDLLGQFGLLEEALVALGVRVWPMVELEADDALASAAAVAADEPSVEQVVICTPDKDLAQCVVDERVVQLDRRKDVVTNEDGVRERYGIEPRSIPDFLALVGDSADGFPGLSGWGKVSAARVLSRYGHLEAIPREAAAWDPAVRRAVRGGERLAERLRAEFDLALLFRDLATLRVDRTLLANVDELAWRGAGAEFAAICEYLGDPGLAARVASLGASL